MSHHRHKDSRQRDIMFELYDRSDIWQAARQHCCRGACQMSERHGHFNKQSWASWSHEIWIEALGICMQHWAGTGSELNPNCRNSFSTHSAPWQHNMKWLWPSDVIWRHRTWSTLVQIMSWCHQPPSHYLFICWLIISSHDLVAYSAEGNFTENAKDIYPWLIINSCISLGPISWQSIPEKHEKIAQS